MEPSYFQVIPIDILVQIVGLTTLEDSLKLLSLPEQLRKMVGMHTYWKLLTETLMGKSLKDKKDFNWARAYVQLKAGKTITEYAKMGEAEAVSTLLEDKDVTKTNANNSLMMASANGHSEVVKILLADRRVDPSANGGYAIMWPSVNGHLEVLRLLLADGRVDPSAGDNQAIRLAAMTGHWEVIKLLLADGRADPSVNNNCAIESASADGNSEVVELLLADRRVAKTYIR